MKSKEISPLHIKNMVCNRCIAAVRNLLDEQEINYAAVKLGEVVLAKSLSEKQANQLKTKLALAGFELLDDAKSKLIEKIKTIIIESVHYNEADKKYNLSSLLATKLHKDYSYLSHLFSDVEGITIEKYAILQKIEKIKELLAYDELSLSEIAFQLGYSSTAHLSAQFKKVTGLTPSHFKHSHQHPRMPLDKV
ncbi:MAG: AraC family transcriptional regulator [Chitinophagaceae bacterium]